MRSFARRLLAVLAALIMGGCTTPTSAQSRPRAARAPSVERPLPATVIAKSPPVPERLWPFQRLYGIDYVNVKAIAERYGFTPAWVTSGRVMQLTDARNRVRLKFEDRSRAFQLDNVRVYLGDPVVYNEGSLYVSKIDVIKTVAPLVRPADYANRLPLPPRIIVLDPGHGGHDDGTSNKPLRLLEKNLTLDTARRLERLLVGRGYKVIMTRTEDRYVTLERRPEIAIVEHADLFISIHFNAAEPSVSGVETWVMTPQFQTSNELEKDKTMISTLYPGNRQDFANILLGFEMQRRVMGALGTTDRGLKRWRLAVLRPLNCPGVLVESAFLSNDAEARRVASPEYRQRIAEAIARGVDDYAAMLTTFHPRTSVTPDLARPMATPK